MTSFLRRLACCSLMLSFLFSCYPGFAANTIIEETIPFTQNSDGHILFRAMVDGVEGTFMFDTGAGLNVFTKRFFDKLSQVTAGDGIFTGFRATGDRLDARLYYARELRIGRNTFPVSALTYVDQDWGPIDGILSLKNFEKDVVITVDYTARTLGFAPPASLATHKMGAMAVIPIQLNDQRGIALDIFCHIRVGDTLNLQFCLDSGAGTNGLRINQAFLKYLPIDTADTVHVRKITHASEFKKGYISTIFVATLDRLSFSDAPAMDRRGLRAQFVGDLIYDGILSTSWLGKRFTNSLPDKEIVVEQ